MTEQELLAQWVLAREDAHHLGTRTHLDFLLEEEGFAMRDIARVADVSVAAIRMWRRGVFPEPPPEKAENRLADFSALVATMGDAAPKLIGTNPAAMLEVAIVAECPLTLLDWFCAGRMDLIFRRLLGEPGADLMSEFDPDWRTRYASEWEVFKNADGELAIRMKG